MLIGNNRKAAPKSPTHPETSAECFDSNHFIFQYGSGPHPTHTAQSSHASHVKSKFFPTCECTEKKKIYKNSAERTLKRRWHCGSLHNGNCTISIFYCILHFGRVSGPPCYPARWPASRDAMATQTAMSCLICALKMAQRGEI